MIKSDVIKLANDGQGCLGKARSDEPLFILRAQDKFAPELIEKWAEKVEAAHFNSISEKSDRAKEKVKRARALAHTMRAWQELNCRKIPD